jgi:hypothetical protein
MKTCNLCSAVKSLAEFSKDGKSKDGHTSYCKQCKQQKDKVRQRNYDYAAMRRSKLGREYGLTLEEGEQLFKKAKYCCQICKSSKALQIDHCHATGQVRGILCHQCNSAIGMLDDSIERCQEVVRYLQNAPKGFNLLLLLNRLAGAQRK